MDTDRMRKMKFADLEWRPHRNGNGEQAIVKFPNGYEASVVRGGPFFTDDNTYEVAVCHGNHVVYDTPVTDDVLGHQTEQEVQAALDAIEALPPRHEQP